MWAAVAVAGYLLWGGNFIDIQNFQGDKMKLFSCSVAFLCMEHFCYFRGLSSLFGGGIDPP